MKKLLLTLSMLLGVNTSTVMAELTQTELHATLSIVTNFILDDNIVHNGTTYGTVTSPFTGKVWLDRNLGASRVCTSFDDVQCYGDYYQWGRNFDGHQDSGSDTTPTLATDINNAGNNFVLGTSSPFDWVSIDSTGVQRSANWSKTDGSSICPAGFRVPTLTELKAETVDNDVTNRVTAFSNFLKLPSSGFRNSGIGVLNLEGSAGNVWTTSVDGSSSSYVSFQSSNAGTNLDIHANGLSVRCLKDSTVDNSIVHNNITHNGTTYDTVTSPFTGRVWLDRNLGADQVCEQFDDSACFGDYYQWGRNFDGHQDSTSGRSSNLVTILGNPIDRFIVDSPDWTSADDNGVLRVARWSKTDGSSVCPAGFRVPTYKELKAELFLPSKLLVRGQPIEIKNRNDAFKNFLKLPSAGRRNIDSFMFDVGVSGNLWTNSASSGSRSRRLLFDEFTVEHQLSKERAKGFSVRCIRPLPQLAQ